MSQCYRCASFDVNEYSSISIGGSVRVYACYACQSLTKGQGINWEKEVSDLHKCAVTLQELHNASPQHKAFVEHHGSVEAYAREHPEYLRKSAERIRQKAAAAFSDPIFVTFLKTYFPRLFQIARFDLDALEEVERQDKAKEVRLQKLIMQFGTLDHYENDAWITRHAVRHGLELLKRRQEIHKAHGQFHDDADFIAWLKDRAPKIYRRATWEFRALACAESRHESPKEYRARHDQISWDDLDAELSAEEQAIRQSIVTKIWADKLTQRLIDEGYPQELVTQMVAAHLKMSSQGDSHANDNTSLSPSKGPEVY